MSNFRTLIQLFVFSIRDYILGLFDGVHLGPKLALFFPLYAFFRLRNYGYAPSKSLQLVENSSIFSPSHPHRTNLFIDNLFDDFIVYNK